VAEGKKDDKETRLLVVNTHYKESLADKSKYSTIGSAEKEADFQIFWGRGTGVKVHEGGGRKE